jgi:hypothetical protein
MQLVEEQEPTTGNTLWSLIANLTFRIIPTRIEIQYGLVLKNHYYQLILKFTDKIPLRMKL